MASMSDIEEEFEDQTEDELEEDLADDDEIDEDDLDDETRDELRAVDEALSQKEQNAKALAIRRALEERAERKRLHDDLDYLDD